jgi:uncharacterized protein YydD (DUF2326 family)
MKRFNFTAKDTAVINEHMSAITRRIEEATNDSLVAMTRSSDPSQSDMYE